jgi:hypothetical protein
MQITLNAIAFDIVPVDEPLRLALLREPAIARGRRRDIWAWDAPTRKGGYLVPGVTAQGLPLPTGLSVFVPRPGANGAGPVRAEGPSERMAERLLAALGAKGFAPVSQALSRVTGVPVQKVPLEAFAALRAHGSYRIRIEIDLAVVAMSNAARNLTAYLFLPALAVFAHAMEAPPEDAPAPGSIRPGYVLAPPTQAAQALRRLALVRRMQHLQAELGGVKPADLPAGDIRRAVAARLGAEWKALQPKAKAA